MEFKYFGGEQRSPEWFQLRIGRITASRLGDWMAVSVAEKTKGKPLKARLDYEKELQYERQFNVSYNNYTNDAMQDGIDFEAFAATQYEKITGNKVIPVGGWYNDVFMASPDGDVLEKGAKEVEGSVEIKIVRDATFTEILLNGVPDKHWKQIQGQLRASKRKWCDYVAVNLNTKKIKIIRVFPDTEFFEYLDLILEEKFVVAEFSEDQLFDLIDKPTLPEPPAILHEAPDGNGYGF